MLNATKGSIQDRATKPFLKALLSDENRVVALIGRAADSKSYRLGIRVLNKAVLEQPVLNATKGSIQNRVVALIGRAADSKSVGWGFESLPPCHFAVGKMIKEENAKIITLSFVACGFLTAFVVRVLFEFFGRAVWDGGDGLRARVASSRGACFVRLGGVFFFSNEGEN